MSNVERKPGFSQVCVWPGIIIDGDTKGFEEFILEEFDTRIQYLEEIETLPDIENGYPVRGTGGRNDVLFAVHKDDIQKFAVPRLQAGIRWIEDVLANELHRENGSIYPSRVKEYRTW